MVTELQHHIALQRANGQCEKYIRDGMHTYRCPEMHGQPAKGYKGVVTLLPYITNRKQGAQGLLMVCWKCSNRLDQKYKKQSKPRPKKTDPKQVMLL